MSFYTSLTGLNAAKAELGKYKELGPRTAEAIPNSTLVMFDDLGHSPQVQDPERFNQTLIENLEKILPPQEKPKIVE